MKLDSLIGFYLGWVAFTKEGKQFTQKYSQELIDKIKKYLKENDKSKK